MKEKLFIFGDSYAASYNEDRYNSNWYLADNKFVSYISWLEEKYDVINYAEKGVSPFQVQKDLFTVMERHKSQVSKSYCLIICPDYSRLDFNFGNDTYLPTSGVWSTIHENHSEKMKNKFIELYGEDNLKFVHEFNKMMLNNNDLIIAHVMSFILLSRNFKRSLIWDTSYTLNNVEQYKRKHIREMVFNNQIWTEHPLDFYHSDGYYPNHFNLDVHNILFEIITNWVDHDVFDTEKLINYFFKN